MIKYIICNVPAGYALNPVEAEGCPWKTKNTNRIRRRNGRCCCSRVLQTCWSGFSARPSSSAFYWRCTDTDCPSSWRNSRRRCFDRPTSSRNLASAARSSDPEYWWRPAVSSPRSGFVSAAFVASSAAASRSRPPVDWYISTPPPRPRYQHPSMSK